MDDSFQFPGFEGLPAPSYMNSAFTSTFNYFPIPGNYLPCKLSPEEEVEDFAPVFHSETDYKEMKRKGVMDSNQETTSSHSNSTKGLRRAKKGRKEDKEHKDVVHVRAMRGQATDSHSLAERARREKINERLKLLKDIVPGCCESMGMAVMLDETINYVQSLRNQIEFLSIQLAAADTPLDEFDIDFNMLQCLSTSFSFEPPSK